jgi:hypothetical protein
MAGTKRNQKAYLEVWLRRMRKEISGSGRLTEAALLLSAGDGKKATEWQMHLRKVMDGELEPDLDLITRLERLVAKPIRANVTANSSDELFGSLF